MRKSDFLDILRDYLSKDFSDEEITDILRDYDEYFEDGLIEGKSEAEIIASLGSPKSIASELLEEVSNNRYTKEPKNKKEYINRKIRDIKIKSKQQVKEIKKKTNNFSKEGFNKHSKILNKFEVPFIHLANFILNVTNLAINISMIVSAIFLGAFIIFTLLTLVLGIMNLGTYTSIGMLFIFIFIGLLGVSILIYQIYSFIFTSLKNLTWYFKVILKNRKNLIKEGDINE